MSSFRPQRVTKLQGRTTTTVSDHRVFAVQKVAYEPPLAHDVFVFTAQDWCNVLAETPERELVFIWQYRFGSDALSLEIPGGIVDPGEEPADAARRELMEETGYEADGCELISVVEPNPALQGNRLFTYLLRGARATGKTNFDAMEDLETVLVPRAEVARLIDEHVITHALVVVALEAYLRKC